MKIKLFLVGVLITLMSLSTIIYLLNFSSHPQKSVTLNTTAFEQSYKSLNDLSDRLNVKLKAEERFTPDLSHFSFP